MGVREEHFRELGLDAADHRFTTVGIGDMSGDVFGNGMLLSRTLRLVAAFDHRHVFLDPNPDCNATFDERARLFALPGSSWDDFDRTVLSEGGGIFSRTLKAIPISAGMQAVLGITTPTLTPAELISAILQAPVDLLWNGGIGTYVKATTETHFQVGDKTNDALASNATELRCRLSVRVATSDSPNGHASNTHLRVAASTPMQSTTPAASDLRPRSEHQDSARGWCAPRS